MVSIFDPAKIKAGAELTKAISDDNGYVKTSINIQASLDTLTIDPVYIGLIRSPKAYINNNTVSAILGGQQGLREWRPVIHRFFSSTYLRHFSLLFLSFSQVCFLPF